MLPPVYAGAPTHGSYWLVAAYTSVARGPEHHAAATLAPGQARRSPGARDRPLADRPPVGWAQPGGAAARRQTMHELGELDHPVFDADNHYYEALDAFTRHLDPTLGARVIQWSEIGRPPLPRHRADGSARR